MEERTSELTPPPRRRVSRRRAWIRRLVWALVAVGVLVGATWAGAALVRHDRSQPQPVAIVPVLAKLHVIFPEGFTRAQMAERIGAVRKIAIDRRGVMPRLTKAGYLAASAHATPPPEFRKDWPGDRIEGFLFPATYEFTKYTGAGKLVRDQIGFFRREWRKVDLRYARSKNLTPYDVLIIASMIEKEVAVPSERPLVAAVIYNRLHARMPLQIDATTRYGLGIPATQSLTNAELASASPYNTRNRQGLPPTPISNPGLLSIQAAAHPARVDYLYFVRKPDKRHHFFTASKAEFDRKSCEYGYSC
jgi:cell division protein YceG involved in septum cleavage